MKLILVTLAMLSNPASLTDNQPLREADVDCKRGPALERSCRNKCLMDGAEMLHTTRPLEQQEHILRSCLNVCWGMEMALKECPKPKPRKRKKR